MISKQIQLAMLAALTALTAASEAPPPLGTFEKVTTQFDGTTFDESVTYLAMAPTDKAQLPLSPIANKFNEPSDFTFKFWFKVDQLQEGQHAQFFTYDGSVTCYMSMIEGEGFTVMCDTPQRERVIASISHMIAGKWFYFSLSVTSQGEGVLSLWDRNGLVVSDSSSNFKFVQTLR